MFQSSYSRWYNYLFHEVADKRVADWPLMAGPEQITFIMVVYFMSVFVILPNYMKNRKPYSLKATILIYNLVQIAVCMYLIIRTLLNGWIQSKINLIGCTSPNFTNDLMAINQVKLIYWAMLTKVAELIETVFFVLRKKQNQVSFLHVYHHVATATLSWIVTKYAGGGMMTFPILINCSIHVLMYIYYTLASLGPEWQKKLAPWKSRMTAAQLIQFVMLVAHAAQGIAPSCKLPKGILVFYIPHILVLSQLFAKFYKRSYANRKRKV
ncbi:hypothetical protein HHI36_003190 [Cryptolaemus montrouzieri]|uniref:Elongation of very long chain fatty acids protein n=1 Tax=Cryptolaemus montrouzieri TaxID=559131 RepID=A0ABD2PE72_9CUCU